jgi:Tol biopolymer transport system component
MAVLFSPQTISRAYGARTLARIPMAGGARRDLLTGVADADWIPGTDTYAVIRDPGAGRPWIVEFPVGTMVHEAPFAWSVRVSPDGSRIAFFEGPVDVFDSAPESMITVIDRSGGKSTVARGLSGIGLAWAPSGSEIWFTATRPQPQAPGTGPQLRAVSLAGVERTVYNAPDWFVLHDISADGRLLVSRNTIRVDVACQRPGEGRERTLGWLVAGFASGLSPDGQTLIFSDALSGRTVAGNSTVFRRSTDGAAAVSLGEARGAGALSPDGRWVLAELAGNRILLPTGADSTVTLPKGDVARFGRGAWLGDSKRIVFTGDKGDGKPRGYIQEIPRGLPRAITPDGVTLAGKGTVRDDSTVLGRVGPQWMLFSIHGGEPQTVPALRPTDVPIQWSADGRVVYTIDNLSPTSAPAVAIEIFRVEVATGVRDLWRRLSPSDPVGVQGLRPTVVITPDARSYCYSYMRRLGDLFVASGLD